MKLIGQFRDLDRPDHFVWPEASPTWSIVDRASRPSTGDLCGRPRDAANATMIDSDDVLLLRPLPSTARFDPLPPRPAPGVQIPASIVGVTIRSLDGPVDVVVVERELLPALATASSPPLAMFVEEASENTFPCYR